MKGGGSSVKTYLWSQIIFTLVIIFTNAIFVIPLKEVFVAGIFTNQPSIVRLIIVLLGVPFVMFIFFLAISFVGDSKDYYTSLLILYAVSVIGATQLGLHMSIVLFCLQLAYSLTHILIFSFTYSDKMKRVFDLKKYFGQGIIIIVALFVAMMHILYGYYHQDGYTQVERFITTAYIVVMTLIIFVRLTLARYDYYKME